VISKLINFTLVSTIFLSLTVVSFAQEDLCFGTSGGKVCDVKINNKTYHIRIDTNGLMLVGSSENSSEVKVSLPENFYIETVKYRIYENRILFVLSITDDEAGSAIIAQFDPINYRILWSTEINAFNISPLLISRNHIYVAGIGTVAKLNLSDGKKAWQHSGLYERGAGTYNSFILPKKKGNTIIFQDSISNREVRVDDSSGKILSK